MVSFAFKFCLSFLFKIIPFALYYPACTTSSSAEVNLSIALFSMAIHGLQSLKV